MTDAYRLELPAALQIKGPHNLRNAPTAYSFSRKRTISDDDFWKAVLRDCGVDETMIRAELAKRRRELFEAAWFGKGPRTDSDVLERHIHDDLDQRPAYLHDPSTVYSTKVGDQVEAKQFIFGRTQESRNFRTAPVATGVIRIEKGCVLHLPTSQGEDRWYLPLGLADDNTVKPVLKAELIGKPDETWSRIVELVQVFYAPASDTAADAADRAQAAAKQSFTAFEIIRADAALIHKQYKRLEKEKKLADALASRAEQLIAPTGQLSSALFETIPALSAQYRSLVAAQPEVDELLIRLADAASGLGYKLVVLTPEPMTYYENNTGAAINATLQPGELYRAQQRTVSWKTSYEEKDHYTRNFWGKKKWHYRTVWQTHERTFTYYEHVVPDYDPWVEAADLYRAQGYQVFLLRPGAGGMATLDGTTLQEIHRRCLASEAFRSKCIVGIPFYEETVIGERMMIGYRLVFRPVAPLINEFFPNIATEEKLSYRLAWTGTSLGELVASIPLAPGEERQVTITATQKYTTSRSIKTSSLAEVTRVDRQDFETLFEAEVRKEKETTQSAGGSAGGSYGGFSGSANFSTSTTTKDMSRQLNRSVARASQEVTRKNKESVEVSVTEERATDTSTSTSFKVKNINVGRTLNINLFKVMNDFDANLVLEDFDFHVEAGPYLAELEEFREEKLFTRSDLSDLFSYLSEPGVFPYDISQIADSFFTAFTRRLASSIKAEYQEPDTDPSAEALKTEANQAKSLLEKGMLFASSDTGESFSTTTFPAVASKMLKEQSGEAGDLDVRSLLARSFSTPNMIKDGLVNVIFEPTSFSYDSGALHADAQVGLIASTEQFSERMRELEEKGAAAQHDLVHARAELLRARAQAHLAPKSSDGGNGG
ncbi:hypothetical protein [Sphingomonas sp.]|jgi:hypothetical protein|uniref:hypothetical protein n=1 Tax=Sphingomonas sp. TaxID=28214 RepID=UPI002DE6FE6C|nr:hypothetical protein [Sphingomonas sp.]